MIFLLVGVLLVLANGFFVATEFATIAARSSKVETLAEDGNRRAVLALQAARQLSLQLAGAQLGVTMASLGLGFVAEPAVDRYLSDVIGWAPLPEGVTRALALVLSLLVVVFVHTVLGETVPKNLAISAPERTLLSLVVPYRLYITAFKPLILALNWVAARVTRLLGIEPRDVLERVRSAEEIAAMLDASHEEGLIEEFQHELLTGALDFVELDVTSVMVPWLQVVTVSQDDTVVAVEEVVVRTGHTRLPVRGRGLGTHIVGFIHAKDLLAVPPEGRNRPLPPARIRQLINVSPDTTLQQLLARMRQLRIHLALVRAPDGSPMGLVTLEDLLEELVGEIRDESDKEIPPGRAPS